MMRYYSIALLGQLSIFCCLSFLNTPLVRAGEFVKSPHPNSLQILGLGSFFNKNFRGRSLGSHSNEIYLDSNYIGWQVAGRFDFSGNNNGQEILASYGYALEEIYFTTGIKYVDYFELSQPELFIELMGREDYYGFSPSIYITRGLSDETTYGEIGMSKDYFVDDWLLNLHTNVSFGQFYTDSFEMNHFDLGIDATTLMTEDVFLSFSVNAFTPLQAIKSLTGESDTEIQLGASILFKF